MARTSARRTGNPRCDLTPAEQEGFEHAKTTVYARTDRMFAWLFLAQWAVAIGLSLIVSPYSWAGSSRALHMHVKLALAFGAVLNSMPLYLVWTRPGWWGTRHVIAATQMLWSALLIMITGGRIETHFHVFGSLAFLAFYRDWKVLPTATAVVAIDHLARGVLWPESVYGLHNPEWWRFLEHATWVAFEDIVLVLGCLRQTAEMRSAARREVRLVGANDNVERKVRERTRQLDQRNRSMAFVLNNMDQGLFTVDFQGQIGPEWSAAVEELLGPIPLSGKFLDYTEQFAPDLAAWFDVSWTSLHETLLPVEVVLAQLPSRIDRQGRKLEMAYKLVDDGSQRNVMIVVTDITARLARDDAERDNREIGALAMRLVSDRHGFAMLRNELSSLIDEVERGAADPSAIRIPTHTIKGTAAMFGITSLSDVCHELETAFDSDRAAVQPTVVRLVSRWHYIDAQLEPLAEATAARVEIEQADLSELIHELRKLRDGDRLVALVESWKDEPVNAKLERLADQARRLSARLGKDPVIVRVECDRTRVPAIGSRFWSSLIHVIRNAVDHGIETPDERAAAGKSAPASIDLRATRDHDRLVIEIEDHGRGIDWNRIADMGRDAGVEIANRESLVDLLFTDGMTTRDEVTETSGRGIGLAAVRDACSELGGSIAVDSEPGSGTKFKFIFAHLGGFAAGGARVSASSREV